MAVLHPFRAVRPVPEHAADVACVPYDVINAREARQMAAGKPLSFLHVIRPEVDLDPAIDEHDDAVYLRGADNMRAFVEADYTVQETDPSVYLYRLIMDGRVQTGIFGCVSVEDYDKDVILKHEKTRPDKEDDRTRHIVEQQAHAEPIMLTFPDHSAIAEAMDRCAAGEPLYDLTADDGVRHTIWRFDNPGELVSAFEDVEHLYVADGHHRCKAASRTAEALADDAGVSSEVGFFPAVLFPMGAMHIMAYNRIIRKLPGSVADFLAELEVRFGLEPNASPEPSDRGRISVYAEGTWYGMKLPETDLSSVADGLDVGRLTEHVLEPMLGINDPRTDPNIDFVGGIRGTAELERVVDGGEAALAISMYPTSVEELVAVSDAGLLMPPKSTWFEPKLRSGLLVHPF